MRTSPFTGVRCLCILLIYFCIVGSSQAFATTVVYQSVEDMTARAQAVALVDITTVESKWFQGQIVRHSQVRVVESWSGELPETLTVLTPGGELDGVRVHVSGAEHLEEGKRAVLFLERRGDNLWVTSTLAWSVFHVDGEWVTRDPQGLKTVQPLARTTTPHIDEPRLRIPLETLKSRVLEARE